MMTYVHMPFSSHVFYDNLAMSLQHFLAMFRGGSRTAATSKMERFVIIVNGFQPLTIITKALHLGCCSSPRSASDVATTIFTSSYLSKNRRYNFHSAILHILKQKLYNHRVILIVILPGKPKNGLEI